jgi:hypothetical protein
MKNPKYKILAENMPAENTLVTEYADEIPADTQHPGFNAHSYEKAVLAHGQLYSAWSLHWDWDKAVSSAQIKECVESLEAIPLAPAPAPDPVPTPAK